MVSALDNSLEDFKLVSKIQSRQRLHSASSTDVVVPATHQPSLGNRSFRLQELKHATRYLPVSPPCHLFFQSLDS